MISYAIFLINNIESDIKVRYNVKINVWRDKIICQI